MNTRQTFNGTKPKKRLSTNVIAAFTIVLLSVTVAAWIVVIGLYISDDEGGRHAVKGNDFKVSQPMPSDLHQGRIDDGGYK